MFKFKKLSEILKERENENILYEKKLNIKRKYTESYPAINVYTNTKIRYKVLEKIGLNSIKIDEFKNLLKEMGISSSWLNKNFYLFKHNKNENTIKLSKYGMKLYNAIQAYQINEKNIEATSAHLDIDSGFDILLDHFNKLKSEFELENDQEKILKIEEIIKNLQNLKEEYFSIIK